MHIFYAWLEPASEKTQGGGGGETDINRKSDIHIKYIILLV